MFGWNYPIKKHKKMNRAIIITIIVIFTSCKQQSEFEKILTTDSEKYFWIKKSQDPSGKYIYFQHQFIFNEDKTSDFFYSNNENIKGEYGNIHIEGEVRKSKDWEYFEENNLFFMFPDVYKVTKYSHDTIKMNLLIGKKENFILVKKDIK